MVAIRKSFPFSRLCERRAASGAHSDPVVSTNRHSNSLAARLSSPGLSGRCL